jgi:hypothetical protein
MNTFKWYLGISLLVLISACTSYNIQKRHYTKGLYVSFLHKTTEPFKKNSSPKRSSANAPAKLTVNQNQTVLGESLEATKLVSYNPITDLKPQKPLLQLKSLTHTSAAQKLKTTKQNFKIKFYKPISTEGKGSKIFKIILLRIINIIVGIYGIAFLVLSIAEFELTFLAAAIPLLLLFAYSFYKISEIKKSLNAKTSHDTNAYNDEPGNDAATEIKKTDFISGYRVMEALSIIAGYSFLMPLIINYINYIKWFKTIPAYLKFTPLLTPSKGIEPFLIVFLGLALLAAWLGTSKYKFSDPKFQKQQRIKTFIISGLLFLTGLIYILIGLANVLNFVGLPLYVPVTNTSSTPGALYLIICGLISIVTALMPSKLLFGKNLITEIKNKFK